MPTFTPEQEAALVAQFTRRDKTQKAKQDPTRHEAQEETDLDDDVMDNGEQDDNDDFDYQDESQDERDARIAQLEQELAENKHLVNTVQGRLTPIQQNYEQARQLLDSQRTTYEQQMREQQRQIEELQQSLTAKQADIDIDEILSEDERDLMDVDQLNAVKKIAMAIASRTSQTPDKLKAFIATEVEQRERQRQQMEVDNYRERLLNDEKRAISKLNFLAHDPQFREWQSQETNADFNPLARSFLSAKNRDEAELYAKAVESRIAQYLSGKKKAAKTTDARTSLDKAADRRPKQDSLGNRQKTLNEIKRLSRSGSRADKEKARKLLNSM